MGNEQSTEKRKMSELEIDLIASLDCYVTAVTRGRDDSHGRLHMKTVAENAIWIFDREVEESHPRYWPMRKRTLIVAWLHDVFDHKYDKDGSLKEACKEFLLTELGLDLTEIEQIMKIIDLISFSKEERAIQAKNPTDFVAILGEEDAKIRHMVSDADKKEAIGIIGVIRCALYTLEHQSGINMVQLEEAIRIHYDEKLVRLHTEFVRTPAGKELTKESHQQLVDIVETPGALREFLTTEMNIVEVDGVAQVKKST